MRCKGDACGDGFVFDLLGKITFRVTADRKRVRVEERYDLTVVRIVDGIANDWIKPCIAVFGQGTQFELTAQCVGRTAQITFIGIFEKSGSIILADGEKQFV